MPGGLGFPHPACSMGPIRASLPFAHAVCLPQHVVSHKCDYAYREGLPTICSGLVALGRIALRGSLCIVSPSVRACILPLAVRAFKRLSAELYRTSRKRFPSSDSYAHPVGIRVLARVQGVSRLQIVRTGSCFALVRCATAKGLRSKKP